jgi:hypothetical protein
MQIRHGLGVCFLGVVVSAAAFAAEEFKPYSPPCAERENVFEFTEKLTVKNLGDDKYEITFAVKGNCDVTVGIVDAEGKVIRHLGAGVLGANAPAPFQKNSMKQTIYWDGKDDLDAYVREPGKLRVRAMLGLKPEFDKLLGGVSPKRFPGNVQGIVVGPDGAYVFVKGPAGFGTPPHGHTTARWFDHDGNYVRTISPQPANLPEEKLGGMGFVEYEPGKRALHGPDIDSTVTRDGFFLPGINGIGAAIQQPVLIGTRIYYCNGGMSRYIVGKCDFKLHYFNRDGSTDVKGMSGIPLWQAGAKKSCLAASPDGQWIYMTTAPSARYDSAPPVVMKISLTGNEPHKVFVGDPKQPGSDNQHLNEPRGLDCDAQGRVYVCDGLNNRIQVFAPDGKFLKTIPVERPVLLRVHQKTGALYLLHQARVQGQSLSRLTKLSSFESPVEEWHLDGFIGTVMALDSWSSKPRLWSAGEGVSDHGASGPSVRIYEEEGKTLRKIADFDEEAKKEDGENSLGRWGGGHVGGGGLSMVCDPIRKRVWFHDRILDLATGKVLGAARFPGNTVNDLAFDKRGYVHAHFDPPQGGVGRFDPEQTSPNGRLKEVPYDYGIEAKDGLLGVIPVKDQQGAKTFQDGLGVNMRGDVAENCNIYYIPKMEDVGKTFALEGSNSRDDYNEEGNTFADFERSIKEMEKRGEQVYFIRRQPGIPLAGATIWTFDWNGELRKECAAIIGRHIAGVQMDEDGRLYFVTARTRQYGSTPFLGGKGGTFGALDDKTNRNPFTATLLKTQNDKVLFVSKNGAVPLDPPPTRPTDFADGFWVEGSEWLYAGASPVVEGGCTCPTLRFHTDWYKRTFVPEAYRHSIGILDTNGNLIMHLGRYGNFDSGLGADSKIPVGGDNIAMLMPRFVSGTDDYLVFYDWGERVAVLKLNYHAEELVPITAR